MLPLPSPSNPFATSPHFCASTTPLSDAPPPENTWWFICQGSELLVTEAKGKTEGEAETWQVPAAPTMDSLKLTPARTQFLGYLNEQPCQAVALAEPAVLPAGMSWRSLRSLHGQLHGQLSSSTGDFTVDGDLGDDLFGIAARAVQLIAWDQAHQFCGQCATPTVQPPGERAKHCPNCGQRQYPQLSPAVIMLVYRGSEVLLARSPRFRPGMYSVLAGFVEPGESLEETVAREVKEEVGVAIKNIRYFGSQPWPFPKSLMIGFVAEYASGTITPDADEIEAAAWFHKHALPPVPGELSIARKLIDWFAAQP